MAGPSSSSATRDRIALIDLKAQQANIRLNIDAAIKRVLDHGSYIMGPEVAEFEAQLAAMSGARYVISCSSGTDALLIALMARGIGPGDAVICPAFTYTATPEAIRMLGATAVFADVREDTFNIDPTKLEDAARAAKTHGLRLRAIMPVDLFGQPAEYDEILPFAEAHDLFVLCDGAQSCGAELQGKKVGQFGHATATSFFPAKPLGCYGDGGAIFTDDGELAERMKSIRLHGKGTAKYDIVRIGLNGRLDTMQAAILIEKLKIFPGEISQRNTVAARYSDALAGAAIIPALCDGATSVWAQYTLRLPAERRDEVAKGVADKGIPSAVYYPRPLHKQPAYADQIVPDDGLAISERLCGEVLSLPMHPYLTAEQQDRVIATLLNLIGE